MTDQTPGPDAGVSTDPTLTDRTSRGGQRRTRLVVIGVVAALVVVGLGWWGIASASSDDETAASDSRITVALQLFPDNLDVRTTDGAALDQTLVDNVYEGLVSRDPKGKVSPSLATKWDVSDDALTYTFTLGKDLSFSNGDALTSEDVVWSIQDVIDNKRKDAQLLVQVDSVRADGDDSVVITLKKPDPTLLYNLAGRAGLVLDKDATNDIKTTAVGSGPFVVKSFKAGNTLTLARNTKYWGDDAKIAGVTFKLFSDTNAIINAVQEGSVDVANVDPTLSKQLEKNQDYSLVKGFSSDKYTLAFNNREKPFTDKRVRQAVRYAIDHEAFAKNSGSGKVLSGPIVDSDPGYEDLDDLYPYDVAKAKKLLADAGYAKGLDLTVTIASFYPSSITDLLTSQLAKAGITLKVKSVEFPTWLKDVYTNHDYQLSIVDHAEARDFGNWADPKYYFGFDDARVQKTFAEASTAKDEKTYASKLQEAARVVSEEAAGDWLYNPVPITAVRKGLKGVPTDSTSARLDLTQVSDEG